jgi:rod shape-determining protein MreC
MPEGNPARVNLFLLVVLSLGQLLLMAGSVRRDAGATLLETTLAKAGEPVVALSRGAGRSLDALFGSFRELARARADNARLKLEVERLRSEVNRSREAVAENERLRRLLGMREALAPRSVAATVIARSLTGSTRMIVLDQGRRAGLREDLPVVAWGGAVGRVVLAGEDYAKVRLITDPNSGVAGLVQRTRAEGMVEGRAAGPLEMTYVPKYADVLVGDRVVTSGLDGVFPKGFGIGTVVAVEEPAGSTVKRILLEPEMPFEAVEEVLVLTERSGSSLLEAGAPARQNP